MLLPSIKGTVQDHWIEVVKSALAGGMTAVESICAADLFVIEVSKREIGVSPTERTFIKAVSSMRTDH